MNRFTPSVPVVLVMSAWSVAALGADERRSAVAPGPAAAATRATSTVPATRAVPARVSTASAGDPSVQRLVCLNMSLQCFAMRPKVDDSAGKKQAASLDLKAPDIRRVVPEVELRAPLPEPVEIEEQQQVQVESTRPEVYVPGGIASLPWAVMHPTQAWRILLPVPAGVAK